MNEMELKQYVRRVRGKFAAMAGVYFMGVFNDNFFKQAALLIAIGQGKNYLQGYAIVVFTVPFILFAAWAGYCADRFSKHDVIVFSKFFELAAMLVGAVGIYFVNWPCIFAMLFMMGLQSTLFGPALNGSLPELYPSQHVPKANAFLRIFSTAAILFGIACAGFALDRSGEFDGVPAGRVWVAAACVLIGVAGVIVSFFVPRFAPAAPNIKFPFSGPVQTVRTWISLKHDKLLGLAIIGNTFFWFTGSLQMLVINNLGKDYLGFSDTLTSFLVVAELVGIAVGGLISTRLVRSKAWYKLLVPCAMGMAVLMAATWAVQWVPQSVTVYYLVIVLGLLGTSAGIYLIPLVSFIQTRSAPERRGEIIAASGCACFCGILVAGPVLVVLDWLKFTPPTDFAVMGLFAACFAWAMNRVLGGRRNA